MDGGIPHAVLADQGLLEDISDVWGDIGDQYSESYKIASTGSDGKQYFVPQSWYPWGLHFRKSMMAEIGMSPEDITTGTTSWPHSRS